MLKLFLDQFAGGTGLRDVVAIPLMLGGGPAHALAVETSLRPVLVEIGASCPTAGLYQIDSTFDTDTSLADWVGALGPDRSPNRAPGSGRLGLVFAGPGRKVFRLRFQGPFARTRMGLAHPCGVSQRGLPGSPGMQRISRTQ